MESALRTQLVPTFGSQSLNEITRSDVTEWFLHYSRKAPAGANRALDILRQIFNYAIDCGCLNGPNPTSGVKHNPRSKATRFLSRDEVARLHASLDAHKGREPGRQQVAIIRLLLLTGCRKSEIVRLQWREFDGGVLRLLDSKTGPRTVFLSKAAQSLIKQQPRSGSPYVFPSPKDGSRPRSRELSVWRKVRHEAGVEDVRLHDLRHTFASHAVMRGVPLPVVARLLGHSRDRMALRYTHVGDREVEAAAERVGAKLAALLDGGAESHLRSRDAAEPVNGSRTLSSPPLDEDPADSAGEGLPREAKGAHFLAMRDFNTAGPVRLEDHYCVPPLDRVNMDEILSLVRRKRYFVLHAPRQTGKTSTLLALRDLLNGGSVGEYRCAYINVESAQAAREDVGQAMGVIASEIALEAEDTLGENATTKAADELDTTVRPHTALRTLLVKWARAAPSPLVLLIDEIDALFGDTLVSVLRQLRTGYVNRPNGFPQSVVLCGVRDVRDYRIHASSEKEVITGGSAFNIKAKSLRLGDFTRAEVLTLLNQHTTMTGQEFAPQALDAVWKQTRGQPWLVNALAQEMCFSAGSPRRRSGPVSERDVFDARENLILRRETHLDQLADKLREPRVRRVIEPLLGGGDGVHSDLDFEYVRDLGLVAPDPPLRIANPIYGEVLPRVLTWMLELEMAPQETPWYVDNSGGLDMNKLLAAFQDFFRQNSEHWIRRAQYTEAGPQLVLQAFLHRVVNGRGRIEREYALGSRRVDLLVVWPRGDKCSQRFVVECKLVKEGRSVEREIERGMKQTAAYMDTSGAEAGHLVLFDLRQGRSWVDRSYQETRGWEDARITVWGA